MPGVLYLCGTPIGNLEDMTFRAVRILKEVAVIAAEDTRHTQRLLNYFDIHTPLLSYHEHNKAERGPQIIDKLLSGEDVAIVSDAGMPGISDPGSDLVADACKQQIKVVPIPGPCAALTGLVAAGLDTTSFLFVGFLNRTKKKRREAMEALAQEPHTLIFYEAPHRLIKTLEQLQEAFGGERKAAVARELTKVYEEIIRGSLAELIEHFAHKAPRGEFTIIVEGKSADEEVAAGEQAEATPEMIIKKVNELSVEGFTRKEAMKKTALTFNLAKREVYKIIVQAGQQN